MMVLFAAEGLERSMLSAEKISEGYMHNKDEAVCYQEDT